MNFESDLIAALATAQGAGAVSITRLSGHGALEAGLKIFKSQGDLRENPRSLKLGWLIDPDKPEPKNRIDQVLVAFFPAPFSFTGEDCLEIQGHGGTTVPQLILEAALKAGARMARPGEFTQRAFLNGRLTLDQAEAVAEMVAAQSEMEANLSARHLEGALKNYIDPLINKLTSALAWLTSILDFDEDWTEENEKELSQTLEDLLKDLDIILSMGQSGRVFRSGLKLVLAGPPNVGKSSLFNTLLGKNRAMVSKIAGTTRDYIEATMIWKGIRVELVDTAGLRSDGVDELEKLGQELTQKQLGQADLILWIRDLTSQNPGLENPPPNVGQIKILEIYNKLDLKTNTPPEVKLAISAKTGQGLDELKDSIMEEIGVASIPPEIVPNLRQQKALEDCALYLQQAQKAQTNGMPPEISAIELKSAIDALGQVTGKIYTEDILKEVFSNFCLGK
jgi:tRNA modification GTPase